MVRTRLISLRAVAALDQVDRVNEVDGEQIGRFEYPVLSLLFILVLYLRHFHHLGDPYGAIV
jgi:hypothetical protein